MMSSCLVGMVRSNPQALRLCRFSIIRILALSEGRQNVDTPSSPISSICNNPEIDTDYSTWQSVGQPLRSLRLLLFEYMLFNCCMNSSGFSEAVKLVSSFRVQKTRCSVAVFQTCSQWRHGSTSLKHGCTRSRKGRSMGPRPEDLPVFLTPSGMMELCDAQETKKSPLVGLDVAPTK